MRSWTKWKLNPCENSPIYSTCFWLSNFRHAYLSAGRNTVPAVWGKHTFYRIMGYHNYGKSVKASVHSFKQFTSRLLKLSFALSMHIYNSHGRHAWFHLHRASRPARSTSEATKYKMKNSLSTVGLEPTTLWFQVWCSTDWASRAWWMLSI